MKRSYTISEISKLYNIGKDSLRYYEKLGILCPKRAENGYRLYTTHDIYRLNVIKDMRSLGFSMQQIQQYLDQRSVDNSIDMFKKEIGLIDQKIEQLQSMKEKAEQCLFELEKSKSLTFNCFEIIDMPVRKCVTLKESFQDEDDVDFLLTKLSSRYESALFSVGNCNTGLIADLENEKYISVIIMGDTLTEAEYIWPEGKYLVFNVHGKMNLGFGHMKEMKKFLADHGMRYDSHALELFIIDSHETADEEEFISQFQIRLED